MNRWRPAPRAVARLMSMIVPVMLSITRPADATTPSPGDTYYTYCLARQAWFRQEYPEALRLLREAAEADPGSADLRLELARLHLDLNQTDEALAELGKAIALEPDAAGPRRMLADLLLTNALRNGTEPGLIDEVIAAYRETVRVDPGDAEAHLNLGKLLSSRSQYAQALESLKDHLKLEPSSEEGSTLAAQVLLKLERYPEAAALLADALTKRPRSAPLHLALLDALEADGDRQGAEQACVRMIEAEIEPMRARFALARLLAARSDHSGAYQQLSDLSRLLDEPTANVTDEDRAGIQLRMIQELVDAQRIDEALQTARAGSARFPSDVRFLLREGEALLLGGRPDEAEKLFRVEVLGQSRDSARAHQVSDVYLAVGARSETAGRVEEAETHLRAAIEWNPINSSALNYLGFMLADRGLRLDEAIRYIGLALERDPGNGAYLDSLGWAYYKSGDYKRAEKLLTEAVAAMSGESEIHDHLGDLYRAMGRTEEAIMAWQNALDRGPRNAELIQSKLDAVRTTGGKKP